MSALPASWPGGAAVAVVFQLMFEQWSGPFVERGWHVCPEFPPEEIARGIPHLATLSWQEYAGRAGFYRLMDMTHSLAVPATGVFSGLAVQKYPEVAREFAERGNELVAHGWAQDVKSFRLTEEEMRESLRRSAGILRETTGYAPVGWMSPGAQAGPHTLDLLAEEGFEYSLDFAGDDSPRLVHHQGRPLVLVPTSFDVNDQQIYARGLNPPSAYVDTFKAALQVLLEEGRAGTPRVLSAVFSAALFGHPFGAWALRECIRHARGLPGVWITTHRAHVEYLLDSVN